MITILGQRQRFCDGISRRNFLRIGTLSAGGLTLADLLRAEALAETGRRPRSIINIYLGGGPSHMDTFDLKPDAPVEYRGDFRPIATHVPGIEICEHLPRLARLADQMAIVRSVTGIRNEHSPRQSDTGWGAIALRSIGGRPGIGAVVSRLQGSSAAAVPTSVGNRTCR